MPALSAHLDIFPTLAEIVGVQLSDEVKQQVEGRSLLPLLLNPTGVDWPDRTLVTHVGRWPKGKAAEYKFKDCSIRDARFTLVNNTELYDLSTDPGESKNVLEANPGRGREAAAGLRAMVDGGPADARE